jgi:hypothetical protein
MNIMKKLLLIALIAIAGIGCSTPDVQTQPEEPSNVTRTASLYISNPPYRWATVNDVLINEPILDGQVLFNVEKGDVIKMSGYTKILKINNVVVVNDPTAPPQIPTEVVYTIQ